MGTRNCVPLGLSSEQLLDTIFVGIKRSMSLVGCVPFFAPRNAVFRAGTRQRDFRPKAKPAAIAGFSVKSLVALPGIEPGF